MWKLAEETLGTDDVDALADWLRTHPRLTQGEQVQAFERAWARWLGVQDAVLVSSGTTANLALIACAARRMSRPRPRVGVSAVTWSTNITPSLLLGHEVTVFDVQPSSLGVDVERVCRAMETGELDILFVTHLLGFNALTPRLVETAARCGVILLEDCCESHGARMGAARVGTFGLGSTFSFYFGHHMSTIEGGMVCSNDLEFSDTLRLMRAHGLARESRKFEAYAAAHPGIDKRFLFVMPGLNFRSSELNAFLGLRQLGQLDERIAVRNRNLKRFLGAAPASLWRDYRLDGVSSFALPLIARDAAELQRVLAVTERLGVESRPVVAGNLLKQPMLAGYDVKTYDGGTPVADHVHACGLYVGNGHHVTEAMVDALTAALGEQGRG
jgi:CDP-6-deoxy-D-xylo-4-hexulose-3-dehydrase